MVKKDMKFVDFKVQPVKTNAAGDYNFDVVLIFSDGTDMVQTKKGFNTPEEANEERDKAVGQLYSGQYIIDEELSVKEYMTYWLEEVKRKDLTSNSYESFANVIYKHIIPFFDGIDMKSIKMAHVQQLYNEKTEFSPSIAKNIKSVINLSLEYAKQKNYVERNVARGINLPKTIGKKKFGTRSIDTTKTLTMEQVHLLIENSKDTPIHMQVLFAVLMGLRKSEINGLKYSDVDYINRTLTVQRQLGIVANSNKEDFKKKTYGKQEIGLKTESSYRTLPIPDLVFEEILKERKLYEQRRSRRKNDKSNPFQDLDYICCSSYGRPRSKSYNHKHFKKLLEENNLPNIRWHDLRSTFCTLLLKSNYSPKAVSKLMGHAKEIITLDVYGDNSQLIEDGVLELQPFIEDVLPPDEEKFKDLSSIVLDLGIL